MDVTLVSRNRTLVRHKSAKRFFAIVAFSCSLFATHAHRPAYAAPIEPVADASKSEKQLDPSKILSVSVFPKEVRLRGALDYQQLVVVGQMANGITVDLTRQSQFEPGGSAVKISASGRVEPVADGDQPIVVRYGTHQVQIPAHVEQATVMLPTRFSVDVQPVLGRLGCNQGTCHGSAEGKNGFKLSLRGYDTETDYWSLLDDIASRRINRAAPDRSLMLLKPIGEVPHAGGATMKKEDRSYRLLRQWIAEGAKLDQDSPKVERIELFPENPVLPEASSSQQMVVIAHYSDGTKRDVTGEAFVESGNIEVLASEPGGMVRLLRRGEAPVLVRYEGRYAATTLTVMGEKGEFVWNSAPVYSPIDELVDQKLRRIQVLPSGLCSDEEFVRRVYLDLTGTVPASKDVRDFLAAPGESRIKREQLVDQLVGSQPFIQHWTNKWADLLQVNRKFLGESGAAAFRAWIEEQIATNRPYDEFAREIILASGSNMEHPAASYYKILRDPLETMENTTHLFLAIRFNCNRCHDHPFERWTQSQYYEIAAYFAQVGLKGDPRFAGKFVGGTDVTGQVPAVEVVYDRDGGDIKNERTGKPAIPNFPYDLNASGDKQSVATRREQLAQWLTSRDNPFFAKSYVNRIWGYLTGVGIIEPIDDIRAGNPPTNPALLDWMTQEFIASGFNTQELIKKICKSRTYQLAVATNPWNEEDQINYSHAVARRLPAEVLYDAIFKAAGSTTHIANLPPGTRAAELPDAGVSLPFLDDFGRPVRESACECERSSGVVLGPVIKLVNGDTVASAIVDPSNELNKLVGATPNDDELIDEVFIRFLGRKPNQTELDLARDSLVQPGMQLEEAKSQLARYEQGPMLDKAKKWASSLIVNPQWQPIAWTDAESTAGATLTPQPDQSFLVSGTKKLDRYILRGKVKGLSAIRLEALTDPSLPQQGPGRAPDGNFVINEIVVKAAAVDSPMQTQTIGLLDAQADFSQQGLEVTGAVDGNVASGWAVHPQLGKPHEAIFRLADALPADKEWIVTIEIDQQFSTMEHSLGRFRVSGISQQGQLARDLPPALASALSIPEGERTAEQWAVITENYRQTDSNWLQLKKAVDQASEELNNRRMVGAQDLAWALINSASFLFNR